MTLKTEYADMIKAFIIAEPVGALGVGVALLLAASWVAKEYI